MLYFSSKTFIDFIPKNDNSFLEKKYNEFEKKLIDKQNKINDLNEKIKDLEKQLKIKKNNLEDKNNNKLTELKQLIKVKNEELDKLKLKLNNILSSNKILYNIKPGEKIFSINFVSIDENIMSYSLICKNTDIFSNLENKLYEDYPQYKDKEIYFMNKGNKINRDRSLDENNIKENDILILYIKDK